MIKKWFKNIVVYFKLLFINNNKVDTIQSNQSNSIISNTNTNNNILTGGIEQEAKIFQRENDLVKEGEWGYGPIVYEADMITIKKESQYGYNDEEHNYKEELLVDDVDLLDGVITNKTYKPKISNNTVEYLEGRKIAFDKRWEEIKKQVREDDTIDGIIKE